MAIARGAATNMMIRSNACYVPIDRLVLQSLSFRLSPRSPSLRLLRGFGLRGRLVWPEILDPQIDRALDEVASLDDLATAIVADPFAPTDVRSSIPVVDVDANPVWLDE